MLACFVCFKPLGIGEAERNWKAIKMNKSGQQAHLSQKKQAIIRSAFSNLKSSMRRDKAQRAGKLWNDEDYTW
jgi:hypothetical protein